jgi:hypothetical protein
LLNPFLSAYETVANTSIEKYDGLMKTIILGSMIYRLDNKWVKYDMHFLSPVDRKVLLAKVIGLFSSGARTSEIDTLVKL